ncbi:MAG: hypothetical protein BWK80_18185 [Desulfobacteraceae bacterium IS3]|nr:MAG: hypothetical protein BWK80_18185 [Desulfobacteraceae bacterium IS3]
MDGFGVRGERCAGRIFLCVMLMLAIAGVPMKAYSADIRAYVDQKSVQVGESLQLTVSVSGGGGDVDISPIHDFKVISRGTSTSVQIVNGSMSRETAYNYALIPLREGNLSIPPLSVNVDGTVYQTQQITVQVSARAAQGQADEDSSRKVFAQAQISNPNPYQGEQMIYTFKLFNAIRIANAKLDKPEFAGFTAKEIGESKTYRTVISGREYNCTELNYMLIPMNAGEKSIEPATLNCDVVKPRRGRSRSMFDSFFDDSFFGNADLEPAMFRTEAVKVNVKPLPSYNGDVKFSGLVGKFDIQAQLENSRLNVGDSTTLAITLKGAGNIMDAESPEIKVPEEFKVYKDNPEEDIQLGMSGYSGRKTFRAALVPIKEGNYVLEAIQLCYFDVSKGSYEVCSTPKLALSVSPSKEKDKLEVTSAPSEQVKPLKKKVEFTGRDILPLKEELDALESRKSLSPIRFALLLLIPALFCLMAKLFLALTRKSEDPARLMAQRAEKVLKEACSRETSGEEFLSCLYRALVSVILSKAGTKGESLTYSEAAQILRSYGYTDETAEQAAGLLEKIESAKFSGRGLDKDFREELLAETKQMVRSLSS